MYYFGDCCVFRHDPWSLVRNPPTTYTPFISLKASPGPLPAERNRCTVVASGRRGPAACREYTAVSDRSSGVMHKQLKRATRTCCIHRDSVVRPPASIVGTILSNAGPVREADSIMHALSNVENFTSSDKEGKRQDDHCIKASHRPRVQECPRPYYP